jgi:hypothetical protein
MERLTRKIIGHNFYYEESIGSVTTSVTVDDLNKLNMDVFDALKELQEAFDLKLESIPDKNKGNGIELILVINSDKDIMITHVK